MLVDISKGLARLMDEGGGISRSHLARSLGVHTSTVTNWLEGKPPKAENLADLCAYFDVPMEALLSAAAPTQKTAPSKEEAELLDYLEELRQRPELRIFMSLAKDATREDAEAAVKIAEAYLKGREDSRNE